MRTRSGNDVDHDTLLDRLRCGAVEGFHFRTPEDITELAAFLAGFCAAPDTAVVGLIELMTNAVEHGLLSIGHAAKLHLRRNLSLEDEVYRRLALPEKRDLRAAVEIGLKGDEVEFLISDPGPGFDWRPFEDFHPERAGDPSGRGIAIARSMGFTTVEFLGRGNRVMARTKAAGPVSAG